MDSIIYKLKSIPLTNKSILLSTAGVLASYLSWNYISGRCSRLNLVKPFLVYVRVQGVKTKHAAASSTEEFYFHLLTLVEKLLAKNGHTGQGKQLEVDFKKLPGQDDDLMLNYEYQLVKLPLPTEFQYKGKTLFLFRFQDKDDLEVATFPWNRAFLDEFLQEVLNIQIGTQSKELVNFFHLSSSLDWKKSSHRKKRPLETIILKDGVKDGLIQDVKDFFASREWYRERGIPYRRGYLLHGPPGTGKSSIVFSIAGEIGYDISILSLSSPHLNDDALTMAMSSVFSRTIVLIEDIDGVFERKEDSIEPTTKMADSCSVTFMGILNALDVVSSQEGRIVFITTNHIKKLDPALIRPGRVDVKVSIDYATDSQIQQMFANFYPYLETEVVKEMCQNISMALKKTGKKVSMACIQSLFVLHKKNPKDAVEQAEQHFEEYADSENTGYLDFYM